MNVKELFDKAENNTLTWDQFEVAAKEANAKFADLNEGGYVSKRKYEDELKSKDDAISKLNDTISARDTDLTGLKEQLAAAGADADKIAEVTNSLTELQSKYDADVKSYKEQLKSQAYEFAVKEFAATKNFTSNAAKRDFIQSMIAEGLNLGKNGTIMGAEDFVKQYTDDNSDAFVVETPPEANTPPNNDMPDKPKPQFVNQTAGAQPAPDANTNANAFLEAFNFTPIHGMPASTGS